VTRPGSSPDGEASEAALTPVERGYMDRFVAFMGSDIREFRIVIENGNYDPYLEECKVLSYDFKNLSVRRFVKQSCNTDLHKNGI
jgi:hypothetical protein